MNAITVWLLISVGLRVGYPAPTVLIERFPSLANCEQVKSAIEAAKNGSSLVCVQAVVVK